MIEHIDRPHHKLNVAFRIYVVEHIPYDVPDVAHINIFINYNYTLGKHRLPETPYSVHYFSRMGRIGFADRDYHQLVKNTLERHVHIDHFRELPLKEGQKDMLDRLA